VKTVKDDGLVSMALRHKKWYSLSLSHTEIVSFHFVTRLLIEKKKKSLFHQKEKKKNVTKQCRYFPVKISCFKCIIVYF